jgi:hypothetical protein
MLYSILKSVDWTGIFLGHQFFAEKILSNQTMNTLENSYDKQAVN